MLYGNEVDRMASVTFLGRHVPTALDVLIAEAALPPNPSPDQYDWTTYNDDSDQLGEEEIVTTSNCVVWSQGGVVRRIFKFKHENEKVHQALLTWFPANTQDLEGLNKRIPVGIAAEGREHALQAAPSDRRNGRSHRRDPRARALVILFSRQAHVYFLNGSNHIVSLPFELEQAYAVPEGLLLQRKVIVPDVYTATALQPAASRVAQPESASERHAKRHGRRRSSVRAAAAPSASIDFVRHAAPSSTLKDFVIDSRKPTIDRLPHLFVLADPLSAIGLVVEACHSATRTSYGTVDENEELLHVFPIKESLHLHPSDVASVVVTANRLERTFTIWQMSCVDMKLIANHHRPHATGTPLPRMKRRSSLGYATATGSSTPKMRNTSGSFAATASFSGAVPLPASQTKPPRMSDISHLDGSLEALSNEELRNKRDLPGRITEGNRRTSSILARTELVNTDHGVINDIALNSAVASQNINASFRARQSFGAAGSRKSEGKLHQSMRASTPGSASVLSDTDITMQQDGSNDPWEELGSEDELEGLANLQRRVLFTKISTVPMDLSTSFKLHSHTSLRKQISTSIIRSNHDRQDASDDHLDVFIHDRHTGVMLDLALGIRMSKINDGLSELEDHVSTERHHLQFIVKDFGWDKTFDIIGTVKLQDGPWSRLGILHALTSKTQVSLISNWNSFRRVRHNETSFLQLAKRVPQVIPLMYLASPVGTEYDAGIAQALSGDMNVGQLPSAPTGLSHAGTLGQFSVADEKGNQYRSQIRLRPQSELVFKILAVLHIALSHLCPEDDDITTTWWSLCRQYEATTRDVEWQALVVSIFSVLFKYMDKPAIVGRSAPRLHNATQHDASNTTLPAKNAAWTAVEQRLSRTHQANDTARPKTNMGSESSFITQCIYKAREHQKLAGKRIATTEIERSRILSTVFLILHVLEEEETLGIFSARNTQTNSTNLDVVLAQIKTWLGECGTPLSSYTTPDLASISARDWIDKAPFSKLPMGFPPLVSLQSQGLFQHGNRNELELAPRIVAITALVHALQKAGEKNNSALMVSVMAKNGMNLRLLETLPEDVALSLRRFVLKSRAHPPTTWPQRSLDLVGRQDLSMLLLSNTKLSGTKPGQLEMETPVKDIHAICQQAAKPALLFEPKSSGATPPLFLIFRDDKKASEAQKLLNPLRVAIAEITPREGSSEAEFLGDQRRLAQLVYKRTMAIPAGQAVMEFCSYQPLLTENITVPSFNTSCNMQPSNTTVNADRSNFTEEKVCWAFFHAGVNAGLRIVRDAPGIDTSWLILNKPNELGNRHAGFLLALGLNGHLKSIAKWLAFKYLTPKHNMTSIGLLLGLAASHLGTMNSLVTRLLSVHATCLLPPGAAELNLSPLTQTAAIMGIGLLYCNSQHRRMTEVLLSEIEYTDTEDPAEPPDRVKNEGYRLAAGFSLGLVNLGTGNNLQNLHDLRIVERLLSAATGPKDIDLVQILDQATAGAVIATALMFMKTGNVAVAKKIDIPTTTQQYEYVRSDILLLRVVAKNLIMWDYIQPSLEWIQRSMPSVYRSSTPELTFSHTVGSVPLDSKRIPFYNILVGFCWSVSLKFSGTGNTEARDVCLFYLDRLRILLNISCVTYDECLTRNALLRFVHLLALCAASVMAGTGDVVTFRRLRAMHAALQPDITFGLHQATHTAIGILFLGQGRYSFTTSNVSIAALLCAFYPIYAQDVLDNDAHLQAFRHFWIFATEARCILTKDAETGQPIVTPIKVVLRDGTSIETVHNDGLRPPNECAFRAALMTPCLLPQLDTIAQVITTSTEYWQVTLDFANNTEHLERFRKDQTIYLRRKSVVEQHGNVFDASMKLTAEADAASRRSRPGNAFEWTFDLPIFKTFGIGRADALSVMPASVAVEESVEDMGRLPLHALLDMRTTNVDDLLVFSGGIVDGGNDESVALDALLKRGADDQHEGSGMLWIRDDMLEALKGRVVVDRH